MTNRLVILGGGESGVGAAILGKKEGFDVFLSDLGALNTKYKDVLLSNEISFEENQHTEALILNADVVVKSPGIPDGAPLIQKLVQNDIEVISEIEFASRFTNAKIIGITGSNGKTTTTSLIYHLLKEANLNVGLGGNIGKSFALQVAENDYDYYVLELSSFQLDGLKHMKIDIALLLNITPDHLDRYNNMLANYIDSKFQIINNFNDETYFFYGKDDVNISDKIEEIELPKKSYSFGLQEVASEGGWEEEGFLKAHINNSLWISVDSLPLKGKHNKYNIIAALLVACVIGLEESVVKKALGTFSPIEHRLESVCVMNGIEYINDSKATNVDSAWYALESMGDNVIWIAGGVDKGNDYSVLNPLVKQKVKGIVCLGANNSKLHQTFNEITELTDATSAEEAVMKATNMAKRGYQVLLSPACASFDLFKNYEDRGKKFKEAIFNLQISN